MGIFWARARFGELLASPGPLHLNKHPIITTRQVDTSAGASRNDALARAAARTDILEKQKDTTNSIKRQIAHT